jgi:transposase
MVNGLRVALNKSNADRTEACPPTRGLNLNFNHRLKYVLKSAGLHAIHQEPFERYYDGLIAKGIRPELARLTLARKIATVTLSLWNRGEGFDELKVSEQAA